MCQEFCARQSVDSRNVRIRRGETRLTEACFHVVVVLKKKAAMIIRAYGHALTETLVATPWKEIAQHYTALRIPLAGLVLVPSLRVSA
jgi:hypothetical protein